MSWGRYPEYRESGVEWIGHVPGQWSIKPLKRIADFTNGEAFQPKEWAVTGVPIIRIQNLNGGEDFNYFEGNVEKKYHVKNGDLLFGWSGNRGTSFGPFLWSRPGLHYLNQHIFLVSCLNDHKKWLYWCLKAVTLHVEEQAHGIIGMVHVTKGDLGSIQVPLPPPDEQAAIAAFLDRETGRIDALVAEQERLIALLREKRQAVISHAVTRGLNPNAPMKDSGVAWLGEVPAHWEVKTAKHLFVERDQRSDNGEETLLTVSHLTGVTPRSEKNVNMIEAETTEGYKCCNPGDLVINTLWAWMGAMGVTSFEGIVSPAYNVYEPRPNVYPLYANEIVRIPAFAKESSRWSKGVWSSRLRLYPKEFFQIFMPLPPLNEQEAIHRHLNGLLAQYELLTTEAARAITLLRERRSALISAAVTGQIDVREAIPSAQAAA